MSSNPDPPALLEVKYPVSPEASVIKPKSSFDEFKGDPIFIGADQIPF